MGIIKKQSISGTIYSYIGVGLGFIISGILFPRLLATDEVGLLRLLISYSTLLAQFAVLGVNSVTVKLFPYFRNDKKKHHGYLGLTLLITLAGFFVATLVYIGLHSYIVRHAQEKSSLFIPYYYYVIPITLFTLLFGVFDTYYRVLYNAVKGIIYKEVIQRSLIIISIVLYFFKAINFQTLVVLYTISIASPAVLLLLALIKDKQLHLKPDINFIDKKLTRQMISIAFFGIIASYSGVLVMNIDLIMIDHYLGLKNAGIYTITFFFGSIILVPMRTMGKISSVVIADSWKINDHKTILDIYQKSTISLGIIGTLLFISIWGNINNIIKIIGNDYATGKNVILLIATANLFDVFSGIGSHIIVNSSKYKWLSYLLLFFAIILILTNIIFIPTFGIVGAAFASMISKFVFNSSKFIIIKSSFGFQPYTINHLLIIIVGLATYYLSTLIAPFNNFIVDIIVRSAFIGGLFISAIYFLNISEDINVSIEKLVKRFIKR